MVLDPELLHSARTAGTEVDDRRSDLGTAEATYAQAIRRLHAAGGSLSEIAAAMGVSRQRIHQIVKASGGVPGRRRRRMTDPLLVCSFCERDQHNVAKLIAGPNVHICDDCVAKARTNLGPVDNRRRCSFCAKRASEGGGLSDAGSGRPRICGECLGLCDEILANEVP